MACCYVIHLTIKRPLFVVNDAHTHTAQDINRMMIDRKHIKNVNGTSRQFSLFHNISTLIESNELVFNNNNNNHVDFHIYLFFLFCCVCVCCFLLFVRISPGQLFVGCPIEISAQTAIFKYKLLQSIYTRSLFSIPGHTKNKQCDIIQMRAPSKKKRRR